MTTPPADSVAALGADDSVAKHALHQQLTIKSVRIVAATAIKEVDVRTVARWG
jgi:hypothetical protein